MPKTVQISASLRKLTNDEEFVLVNADTVGNAFAELDSRFPGFAARVLDEEGRPRRAIGHYLNGEDIRFHQNLETPLEDGDCLTIALKIVPLDVAASTIAVAELLRQNRRTH